MTENTDDILKKYGAKIEGQMKGFDKSQSSKGFSKSYEQFRLSMVPEFSRYERWCKSFGNFKRGSNPITNGSNFNKI